MFDTFAKNAEERMYYSAIKTKDITNGPGVRVSLFVSGCTRHCDGCFNKETWSFTNGKVFDNEAMEKLLSEASFDYIDGLSILGGEPFESVNILTVDAIIDIFKKQYPNKDIWIWSGFTYEELVEKSLNEAYIGDVLSKCDVLVDGPFIEEKKDLLLRFRGSSNQRIIDLNKSYVKNTPAWISYDPVEWHDDLIYDKRTW